MWIRILEQWKQKENINCSALHYRKQISELKQQKRIPIKYSLQIHEQFYVWKHNTHFLNQIIRDWLCDLCSLQMLQLQRIPSVTVFVMLLSNRSNSVSNARSSGGIKHLPLITKFMLWCDMNKKYPNSTLMIVYCIRPTFFANKFWRQISLVLLLSSTSLSCSMRRTSISWGWHQ